MLMAGLNEWPIHLKRKAVAQTTPVTPVAPYLKLLKPLKKLATEMRASRCTRLPSFCDTNILRFSKETQRFFAAFATHTALFHPPEGDA